SIKPEGTFAVELSCPSEALRVDVAGVGVLPFPISAAMAEQLCAMARPAPFGRRESTLHDKRVRDTWEIPGDRLQVDMTRFHPVLDAQLQAIQAPLGLAPGGRLTAVLDKLLIYGPGQFFAPHRDTERHDDMIGSLVVILPCRHKGGALAVEHRGERRVFE